MFGYPSTLATSIYIFRMFTRTWHNALAGTKTIIPSSILLTTRYPAPLDPVAAQEGMNALATAFVISHTHRLNSDSTAVTILVDALTLFLSALAVPNDAACCQFFPVALNIMLMFNFDNSSPGWT